MPKGMPCPATNLVGTGQVIWTMVVVDTTVWVDYFRGSENPETNWLDAQLTRQLWCMREGQNFSSCWRNCGGRATRRLRSRYSFVILLVALKESVSELQASHRSLCHSSFRRDDGL